MSVPTPQPIDAAKCVMRRWRASQTLRRLVPGRLWFGRVPDTTRRPYASLAVVPESPTHHSMGLHVAFGIDVSVWTAGGDDALAGTIQRAMDVWFSGQQASMTMPVPNQTVILMNPSSGSMELDPSLRAAADVCVSRLAWRMLVEGR